MKKNYYKNFLELRKYVQCRLLEEATMQDAEDYICEMCDVVKRENSCFEGVLREYGIEYDYCDGLSWFYKNCYPDFFANRMLKEKRKLMERMFGDIRITDADKLWIIKNMGGWDIAAFACDFHFTFCPEA